MEKNKRMMNHKDRKDLKPIWVSGFLQGEGCFSVSFSIQLSRDPKVEVRPSFAVIQPIKSKEILFQVQTFFDCGYIRRSRKDGCYRYEVRSIKDLVDKIIPHVDNYPLLFEKAENFKSFKWICLKIHSNQHKNLESLKEIIELAYSMNLPGSRKHSKDRLLKLVTS